MKNQYAIVQSGGHQFKLSVGQSVTTDRQAHEKGQEVTFDRVLLLREGERLEVGRPWVKGSRVVCEVRQHRRGKKLTVFKFERRKNHRRTIGHRQDLTDLLVKEIRL